VQLFRIVTQTLS